MGDYLVPFAECDHSGWTPEDSILAGDYHYSEPYVFVVRCADCGATQEHRIALGTDWVAP